MRIKKCWFAWRRPGTNNSRAYHYNAFGLLLLAAAAIPCMAAGADAAVSFVGAAVCAQCHDNAHREWSGARHGKMLQPATASSVEGDFRRSKILLRGTEYRLRVENGIYYISQSGPSGKQQEHRVDYTLGSRVFSTI